MNKKIRNATSFTFDNIVFKSKLEVMVYKTLIQEGFKVDYEPCSFALWKGFKPIIPFYNQNNKTKDLTLESKKIIDIRYTPDFITIAPDGKTIIIIEVKGIENDVFYIKKKLFREYLEDEYKISGQFYVYFEIRTKKQLLQAINIIRTNYGEESKSNN